MKLLWKCAFALVLLFVSGVCSQQQLEDHQCVKAVKKCQHQAVHFYTNHRAEMRMTEMRKVCSKYSEANDCILTNARGCRATILAALRGINDAIVYLCEENPHKTLRYSYCLAIPDVYETFMDCYHYADFLPENACRKARRYVSCGYDAMSSHCRAEETKWFEIALEKTAKHISDMHGCDIAPPSEEAEESREGLGSITTVTIIVIVVFIVLAIVAGLLCAA